MAQTFADNMFDVRVIGFDLKFKDVNPERPYIVLNATNGTSEKFSKVFTFTREDFSEIDSDINEYEISRAVMATASFPAVFNFMTLHNFKESTEQDRYVHVFDGGNSDNLGLKSVMRIIDINKDKYRKIVVILIDAFTQSKGVSSKDYDARKFFDYAVDLNFLDSLDTLLSNNRTNLIEALKNKLDQEMTRESVFYHIQFNNVMDYNIRSSLNDIRTDFKINEDGIKAVDEAVKTLIVKDNDCLKAIKDILVKPAAGIRRSYCSWQN
jgi:NTE family protein